MVVSLRSLLTAFALATAASAPLAAQGVVQLAGRVVRLHGADTVAVAGVPVSAHRVGRAAQGVVDSATSGAGGTFRFRLPGDSAALYLVSARFGGVEFFSEPVRSPGARGLVVVVSDTSSTTPVRFTARHVIVSRPDAGGTRAILDLFTIQNDSPATRVARDSLTPTWRFVLPAGVLEPAVEEGDVSAASVQFRADTLLLFAPVAPGRKNLMLSYRLPAAEGRPRWTAPSDSFDLLVEEADATVGGAGLEPTPPVTLMGRELRRWSAHPPAAGEGEVRFTAPAADLSGALWWLVALVAVAIAGGGFVILRRRPRPLPASVAAPVDVIEQLARLDARYAGREANATADEWSAYQAERARLKAMALARRRPGS